MRQFSKVSLLIGLLGTIDGYGAAVSTSSPEATQVAIEVLKSGGNAADAACAAVFALNVTQPDFTGLGGGGFVLIQSNDSLPTFLDFRESAASSVKPTLFYNSNGNVITDWLEKNTGPQSVGVPGVVAGCEQVIREYGHLGWKKVFSPGIQLARSGFQISQLFQEELSDQWKRISKFPFTKTLLQGATGSGLKKGETLKQPILAQSFEELAEKGGKSFYQGAFAKKWVEEARTFGVRISITDLQSYQVQKRSVVPFQFGKFQGVTVSAPSSAAVTLAGTLRYLDHYFSKHLQKDPLSIERFVAEIESKAFFAQLRNARFSDPSRMKWNLMAFFGSKAEKDAWNKLDQIIQKKLAQGQASRSELKVDHSTVSLARASGHTTHISVVDDSGMAVALTSSVGGIFGSGIILPKSGFVLNSTLGDFDAEEGHLNSPQPKARPLSNMSPFFIYDGKPSKKSLLGVLGAAGGPLIPSGIVDLVLNYYFFQLKGDEAIRSPRVHSEDGSHVLVEKNTPPFVVDALKRLGYQVETDTVWAVFEGAVRLQANQRWEAVAETRYDGLGLSTQ